jgi:hypothetical protein
MSEKTTSEVAVVADQSGYIATLTSDFAQKFAEEVKGLELIPNKIKIPSGGGVAFEIPDENGEISPVKDFVATVLHKQSLQAYYEKSYDDGDKKYPPDCVAMDGEFGVGNPGGKCAKCPLNEFGTSKNGAKACKRKQRLFVIIEGDLLPMQILLPTGSLREWSNYVARLLNKGKASYEVVTKFSLKRATSANGTPYSQAQFAKVRDLTAEEILLLAPCREQAKLHSGNVDFADEGADFATPKLNGEVPPVDGDYPF